MRAVVLHRLGGPEELKLEELPDPIAPPGGAVVRLRAAALNHRDTWIRLGQYGRIQLPCVPGSDGAGVIESVGEGVGAGLIGRRVVIDPSIGWGPDPRAQGPDFFILGMPHQGTLAERIAQPIERLHEIPPHLSFTQAAALPLAGVTAFRALVTRGEAKAGDHVLVTGIGGGVATFALRFAKALGAQVSVTSGSDEKLEKAKVLGADWGANYRTPGWEKALVKAAGRPPDVIVDGAGGDGLNQLVAIAAPGARIVVYGATRGPPAALDLRRIFFRQLDLRGSTMGTAADFTAMLKLVEEARLEPVIDRVYPLGEVVEASRRFEGQEQLGKIVLECPSPAA